MVMGRRLMPITYRLCTEFIVMLTYLLQSDAHKTARITKHVLYFYVGIGRKPPLSMAIPATYTTQWSFERELGDKSILMERYCSALTK